MRAKYCIMRGMAIGIILTATAYAGIPRFQDLMDPTVFPDAQRGMTVESATVDEQGLKVVTTGAEMTLDAVGTMVLRQRIGHPREMLRVTVDGFKGSASLTHHGSGFAFAQCPQPRFDLRVNGDSLFMIHAKEPLTITIRHAIAPLFTSSFENNHICFDEWGGYGLYCSDASLDDAFAPYGETTAQYRLPADAVLWIGVCPPQPFDWERSFRDHVVWHWSKESAYPPSEVFPAWSREGNIVLLQSEMMLWKDWNLAFEPRLGEEEFARVRDAIHANGMRFMVYTSPAYFFMGTPMVSCAMNSFENFTNWPPARGIGDNMDLFLVEIAKVMRQYKPDGLYFDGQYYENPAALYALARHTRALLGDSGLLEWHSSVALGPGTCFLPQADAYVDFILRGEGRDVTYTNLDYMRFFVSGYNTSNSIGVLCNNGPAPTPELIRNLLSVNGRMHSLLGWMNDPAMIGMIHAEYRAKLTPALREEVERSADQRQLNATAKVAELTAEYRSLNAEPQWTTPVLKETFEKLPVWAVACSPKNMDSFSISEGQLRIAANAHTFAYLTVPVDKPVRGMLVKLKRASDGGMSWGPAMALQWMDGTTLRIGLRSDGLIQTDIAGEQRLNRVPIDNAAQWVWLRVRWQDRSGVCEYRLDGQDFRLLWSFAHGGVFCPAPKQVLIGKVPYNGQPIDNTEPGPAGECFFDECAVY